MNHVLLEEGGGEKRESGESFATGNRGKKKKGKRVGWPPGEKGGKTRRPPPCCEGDKKKILGPMWT